MLLMSRSVQKNKCYSGCRCHLDAQQINRDRSCSKTDLQEHLSRITLHGIPHFLLLYKLCNVVTESRKLLKNKILNFVSYDY